MYFVSSYDILFHVAKQYMLSWSSGQDVALSRRNQGFDSPREYQKKNLRGLSFWDFSFAIFRGVEPEIAGAFNMKFQQNFILIDEM